MLSLYTSCNRKGWQSGRVVGALLFALVVAAAVAGFVLFVRKNPPASWRVDVPSLTGSSSSDRIADFQQLPEPERTRKLGSMVTRTRKPCNATDALYKGNDDDGSAYYVVTCSNETRWMVALINNPEGSILVTSCKTMQMVGDSCVEVEK